MFSFLPWKKLKLKKKKKRKKKPKKHATIGEDKLIVFISTTTFPPIGWTLISKIRTMKKKPLLQMVLSYQIALSPTLPSPINIQLQGNRKNLGTWRSGNVLYSHWTNHSKGVMILVIQNCEIEQASQDKNGRFVIAGSVEAAIWAVSLLGKVSLATEPSSLTGSFVAGVSSSWSTSWQSGSKPYWRQRGRVVRAPDLK